MAAMMQNVVSDRDVSSWLPWILGAAILLYMVGYVDGSVLGAAGAKLNYVHEFFHHARHVALMCH